MGAAYDSKFSNRMAFGAHGVAVYTKCITPFVLRYRFSQIGLQGAVPLTRSALNLSEYV